MTSDSDSDSEIFKSGNLGYSFLRNNLSDIRGKSVKEESHLEECYEAKRVKKSEGEVEVHQMLPIKTKHGLQERSRVVQRKEIIIEPEAADEAASKEPLPQSISEIYSLRQSLIIKAKQEIAKLSCNVIEDPYNNIPALKRLRTFCTTEDAKAGQTIRKIAIISLAAVFNDILPSYHVKPSTDLDSLSKEVKAQHSYETDLLRNYQLYLEILLANLNTSFQTKKKNVKEEKEELRRALGLTSLRAMADLLSKHYDFNLRSNLIVTLVPYGCSKHLNGRISRIVIDALKEVLKDDEKGEASVEIVRAIAQMVKKKGTQINPELLHVLSHVRLAEIGEASRGDVTHGEKQLDTSKLSKKQRKHRKEQAKVRKQLLEANASENKSKQSKLQANALESIFVIYFRILKEHRHSILLPIALEGLSKFAHLINVNFFGDLFECLKGVIHEEDLSLDDSLHCISTVFTIVTGQGSVLEVDVSDFYSLLYQNILLISSATTLKTFHLLKQTLRNASKRKIPLAGQMAMIKRLCTVAETLHPVQAIHLLAEARTIMRDNPKTSVMLEHDNEYGRAYLPSTKDPILAHANGAVLWELSSIARQSISNETLKTAKHICNYDPSKIKRSEVEHFSRLQHQKDEEGETFVILNSDFPASCSVSSYQSNSAVNMFMKQHNNYPNGTNLNFRKDFNLAKWQ